jgi:hypothetical protein
MAGTGCAEQSAAIRVGDDTVSEKDFLDELEAWAGNEALVPEGQVTGELGEDSFIQPFVGSVVQQRVVFTLYEQLFEDEGLELTSAERAGGRDLIDESFGEGVEAGLPEDFADDLGQTTAMAQKLSEELGAEELQSKLRDLAEHTEVEVGSRFGSWDHDAFMAAFQGQQASPAVLAPKAPLAASGSGDEGGADSGSPAG